MTIRSLLSATVGALEAEGIPYMLTGSVVSSMYGEPRSTLDLDVVIDPAPAALDALLDRITALGLYVDHAAAAAALDERGQFNALAGTDKVDFVIRKDTPFGRAEFDRRRRASLEELTPFVVSPEDLLLVKLVWAVDTGSERQLRDVEAILAVSDDLDLGYVSGWAERLGIADRLRMLVERSQLL